MTEYPVEQKDIAKKYHQENLRTPSLCKITQNHIVQWENATLTTDRWPIWQHNNADLDLTCSPLRWYLPHRFHKINTTTTWLWDLDLRGDKTSKEQLQINTCNPALGLYLQNRSSLSAIFSQNDMADRKWTVIGWSHSYMRERKLPLVAMENALWFPGSVAKARQI